MAIEGIKEFSVRFGDDVNEHTFFGFSQESIARGEERLHSPKVKSIAYFSMEFGLAPSIYHQFITQQGPSVANTFSSHRVFSNLRAIDRYHRMNIDKVLDLPIYSGGLGVLAGDALKSAADLGLPVVGIGILWNKGYFKQNFWFESGQMPDELRWDPYSYPGLIPLDKVIEIQFQTEKIYLRLWKYYVYSYNEENVVPLVLLDSNIPENGPEDDIKRCLTNQLYRSDNAWWKIIQRAILGIGGVRALAALGYVIDVYHLNEGHAALAFVEKARGLAPEQIEELKKHFAYTCHTPVEAGHDRFALADMNTILTDDVIQILRKNGMDNKQKDLVNLTRLAMNSCAHVNAVAQKHGEVTRIQFPEFQEKIATITNGIHTFTWMSRSIEDLLDTYGEVIGDWKNDPTLLKNVVQLKDNNDFRRALWEAHKTNKRALTTLLRQWLFDPDVFTIAWARRVANYKRPSLILQDVDRLIRMAHEIGPLQIIFAGKAHPNDNLGQTYVNKMLEKIDSITEHREIIRIYMLENYDTFFGKMLTSSVDVWLNNPLPPFEASGTSGMKAILNGVIQLSTIDGWVVEAQDKNIGRLFGYTPPPGEIGTEENLHFEDDSQRLYETLQGLVALYYESFRGDTLKLESEWIDMMINCIALSGYFSTHRMISEYNSMIWNASTS